MAPDRAEMERALIGQHLPERVDRPLRHSHPLEERFHGFFRVREIDIHDEFDETVDVFGVEAVGKAKLAVRVDANAAAGDLFHRP